MEIPKEVRDKFLGKPEIDPREQKKRSRMMYRKRKLDKDIKNYIKNTTVIKFKTIDAIAAGHGFYFG